MRAFLHGCLILGLAAVVFPWDALDGMAKPERLRGAPASDVVPAVAPSTAPGPGPQGAPGPPPAAAQVSAPAPAQPIERPAASNERAVDAVASRSRPMAAGSARGVREHVPGSTAHSEAIAANIASEEFQDMVSPVARLYLAYFNRVPDYEGFDYYVGERDRGEPLEAIADEFAGSAEFTARYGALDNGAFVDRVHQNIFGFSASAEVRAYWVDLLESGRLTRGQVMLINSESPGYVAMTAHEVFVAIAYAETLGRAPDAADLSRWVRFLDAGNPRRAVIDGLLADRGKR